MPKGSKKRAAAKKKALEEENSVNAPENQERNSSVQEAAIANNEQVAVEILNPVINVEPASCRGDSKVSENEMVQQFSGLKCDDVNKLVDMEITEITPSESDHNNASIVVQDVSSDVPSNAADHVSLDMYGIANEVLVGKLKSEEQVLRFKASVTEELKEAENVVAFLQKVLTDLNSLQA